MVPLDARRDPTGLCFPYAWQESRARGGVIVHAFITHPATGKRFWHAWVERRGRVYDDAGHHLPVRRFYALMNPRDVRRYTVVEAAVNMLRTRHHGPWEHEETPSPPPPRRRSRKRKAWRAEQARG